MEGRRSSLSVGIPQNDIITITLFRSPPALPAVEYSEWNVLHVVLLRRRTANWYARRSH